MASILLQELADTIPLEAWTTFLRRVRRVHLLVDDGYTKCPHLGQSLCRQLSRDLSGPLFENMTTLCINVRNAYPFILSPSVTDLTILITFGQEAVETRSVRQALRDMGSTMRLVEILRIDGDDEIGLFRKEIAALCSRFPLLRRVVLAPSAVLEEIVSSLLRVRSLSILDVAECGRTINRKIVMDDTAGIRSVSRYSRPKDAVVVQRLGLKLLSPFVAAKLFSYRSFPCLSIADLWLRFPSPHTLPDGSVKFLLVSLSCSCVNLARLSLRFGPSSARTGLTEGFTSPLHLTDLEPLFVWSSLVEFSIDHPRSIFLSDTDYYTLTVHMARFSRIWLNPFPVFPSSSLPGLHILRYFAAHCSNLRSLALCIDATDVTGLTPTGPVLTGLQEFSVGWSPIATAARDSAYETRWKAIAYFLLSIFPSHVSLIPLQDMLSVGPWSVSRSDSRPSWMIQSTEKPSAVMYSLAWKCVAVLLDMLRSDFLSSVA